MSGINSPDRAAELRDMANISFGATLSAAVARLHAAASQPAPLTAEQLAEGHLTEERR